MALPMCAQTKWLYYNTDLLEQAGYSEPPKTWDELFEMGQNMVSKGLCKYPIAWAAKQARVWYATGLYASPLPAAPCGMTMATGIQ